MEPYSDDDDWLREFLELWRQATPKQQRIVMTILRTGILRKTYPPDVIPTPGVSLADVEEALEAVARIDAAQRLGRDRQ